MIDYIEAAQAGKQYRPWYHCANVNLRALAHSLHIDPDYLIDMAAIMSPNCSTIRAVRKATIFTVTKRYAPDCTRSTKSAVQHYLATGEIRGPKTCPYAAALKGDPDAIVIDRWMLRAFNRSKVNLRIMHECADTVAQTAHILGWEPAETQAAIWGTTLTQHGRKVPFLNLEPYLPWLQ